MKKERKKVCSYETYILSYSVKQNNIEIIYTDGTIVKRTYSIEEEKDLLKKMQN